jgi:hypothetical protein
MKIDPNKTWKLAEERARAESDPKRRANLEIVIEHMKAEARCDIDGVLATLSENPTYLWHSEPDDPTLNPTGSKEAVAEFYDMAIVRTGAHRLEWDVDRIIVDENSVFTEGMMRLAFPGRTLIDMGIDVDDPDAYYLSEARTGVVWPIEPDTGLIIGEEIYKCVDEMAGIADRKISLDDIAPLAAA